MHVDLLGHFAQGQRAQFGYAAAEEAFLLAHNFGSGFEDGLLPLVKRADQPVRIGQLFFQPALRLLVRYPGIEFEKVAAIDDQLGQGFLVQHDVPSARVVGGNQDVGHHGAGNR